MPQQAAGYFIPLRNNKDVFTSLVSTVAVTTVRDILLIGSAYENIVYIGTTIANNPILNSRLEGYTRAIGKTPYFPKNGEYSLAMGAFLED